MVKKIFLSGALVLALVLPVMFANAADYLPKSSAGFDSVVVGGMQEYKNLYVAGNSVVVTKNILGDLFSFGSTINIGGEVEKDLFVLGGTVTVTSPIHEDARIAGGTLIINAPIGGDLLVAGGTVTINQTATVAGDLWVAGSVVSVASPVTGNMKVSGEEVYINSVVSGTLEVSSSKSLTFGPQSQILGKIVYSGKNDPVIQEGAQLSTIERKNIEKAPGSRASSAIEFILSLIFKLITLFVSAWVLVKLFHKRVARLLSISDFTLTAPFWKNVGIGLLCLIVVPIVSFLLLISSIGVYLGIILLVMYMLAIFLCIVLSSLLLGSIIQRFQKRKNITEDMSTMDLSWKGILTGVLAYGILCMIPFFGSLSIFILFLAVMGGVYRTILASIEN